MPFKSVGARKRKAGVSRGTADSLIQSMTGSVRPQAALRERLLAGRLCPLNYRAKLSSRVSTWSAHCRTMLVGPMLNCSGRGQ